MNFTNKDYKNKAKEILQRKKPNLDNSITNEDAFLILIHNLDIKKIDNLCNKLAEELKISIDEAYYLTQNTSDEKIKKDILRIALDIILNKDTLGTEKVNGFNTSEFINHSIYEAIFSYELATLIGINNNYAFNYALLHDYGRKYTHKFDHVTIGFEKLYDLGLYDLSKASLSHSFINGGKYCCNDGAKEGFKVDYNGKESYRDEEDYDDIYDVLSTSHYNQYDEILNIADLIATSYGIVSPEERINDIAKRRNSLDTKPNRKYFLASYANLLIDYLYLIGYPIKLTKINFNTLGLNEIKKEFARISSIFYYFYLSKKTALDIEYKYEKKEKKRK